MADIAQHNVDALVEALRGVARQEARKIFDDRRTSTMGTVSRIGNDGVIWVSLAGSDIETPVALSSAEVKEGQTVSVTVRDGRAVIVGNVSDPAAGVIKVEERVAPIEKTALQAISDAGRAREAADSAEADALRARESADDAAESAGEAAAAAEAAIGDAAAASSAATQAADSAASAASSASAALQDAANARQSAANAASSAAQAHDEATAANRYALGALNGLSTLESVIDTVNWFAAHKVATTDTSVQSGKTYYEYDSQTGTLSAVTPEGTENPATEGWWELDETIQNYVASHVAETDDGLYVASLANGWRVLVSSGGGTYPAGVFIVDPQGVVQHASTANGITFSNDKPFTIGDNDAYIHFDGDGHITIGGDGVGIVGGKTLSELVGDVEQAVEDSQTALDACFISLTSTNGTVFKQDQGVSTTIVATIFANDGERITTASGLAARYGAGAFLQWRWKNRGDADFSTLSNADPRLGAGGFTLTISPADISTQAVIDCELCY